MSRVGIEHSWWLLRVCFIVCTIRNHFLLIYHHIFFYFRPRKLNLPSKPSNTKALISGEDPYIVDAVTEKFFPTLSLESRQGNGSMGNSSLQLITLKEGDKSVTLPSLSIEQNYSQMLSELAMNI